jgi:hypothetical protein
MIGKNGLKAGIVAALGVALAVPVALVAQAPNARADDISTVEGARAKERQGRPLTRMDREQLRRHGGNDDYAYRWHGGEGYDPVYGPGITVYMGPRQYYRPPGY